MNKITVAIPSEDSEGLAGKRSDHFGHCPSFTLVEIGNDQVVTVRAVDNIAHVAGGCMKPVAMLAENGVTAMVVAGIGRGPFQKMQQHNITIYHAPLQSYPDVQSAVHGFIDGALPQFAMDQLCTGSGQCHH